ncbi:C6 transcription factor (Acr-2), partial [Metarhizium majus ARSEF 297]
MYDSVENPLRKVTGAALHNPLLLSSIIALSARHLANARLPVLQPGQASPSSTWCSTDHTALLFKHKALKGLSDAVQDPKLRMMDTTVASALLLVFLNLLESGRDDWNTHLEGIKRIMSQIEVPLEQKGTSSQGLGLCVTGLRDFVVRQIYVIDVLGATYTNPKMLLSPSTSPPAANKLLQEKLEHSYLGCPAYILHTLGVFSSCRDFLVLPGLKSAKDLGENIERACAMLTSTERFDSRAWAAALPQMSSAPVHVHELAILAEVYKIGAQIFGRRVIDALVGETTVQNQDYLVHRLLSLIRELRSNDNLLRCILWPMVIASLECREIKQKEFLTGCLQRFWLETRCLNVVNTEAMLRKRWQQEEREGPAPSQWIFTIGRLGGDWLLI